LVKWADVLVTNFPPRVRQRLKLNYEDVSPLNPRLIYADIIGYGELGPEADKPGFDVTAYWARSGLMHFTHEASSPPAVPVPGIGDHATAISLYAGIVSGLYRRERTGKGCNVSTSLIANDAWATTMWLQAALQGAKFYGPIDRHHSLNALFASYRTQDNRWVLLAFVEEDKNWPAFVQAIERPDLLTDSRFADAKGRHANSGAFVAELDRVFGAHPLAHWTTVLDVANPALWSSANPGRDCYRSATAGLPDSRSDCGWRQQSAVDRGQSGSHPGVTEGCSSPGSAAG
jgi:formyl-CoA transferase